MQKKLTKAQLAKMSISEIDEATIKGWEENYGELKAYAILLKRKLSGAYRTLCTQSNRLLAIQNKAREVLKSKVASDEVKAFAKEIRALAKFRL